MARLRHLFKQFHFVVSSLFFFFSISNLSTCKICNRCIRSFGFNCTSKLDFSCEVYVGNAFVFLLCKLVASLAKIFNKVALPPREKFLGCRLKRYFSVAHWNLLDKTYSEPFNQLALQIIKSSQIYQFLNCHLFNFDFLMLPSPSNLLFNFVESRCSLLIRFRKCF